jgi:hypothetical protein
MKDRNPLQAADLYVMLERALRRESRNCHACTFSLHAMADSGKHGDWSIISGQSCSDSCRTILEDIVARYRDKYSLAA